MASFWSLEISSGIAPVQNRSLTSIDGLLAKEEGVQSRSLLMRNVSIAGNAPLWIVSIVLNSLESNNREHGTRGVADVFDRSDQVVANVIVGVGVEYKVLVGKISQRSLFVACQWFAFQIVLTAVRRRWQHWVSGENGWMTINCEVDMEFGVVSRSWGSECDAGSSRRDENSGRKMHDVGVGFELNVGVELREGIE